MHRTATQFDCAATYGTVTRSGTTFHDGHCTTCGVSFIARTTLDGVVAQFNRHATIPAPPDAVLAAPLTAAIVSAYPDYYINGRGRRPADTTDCPHGCRLSDSCPNCD